MRVLTSGAHRLPGHSTATDLAGLRRESISRPLASATRQARPLQGDSTHDWIPLGLEGGSLFDGQLSGCA
jgi:hypothetical protein